MTPLVKAGVIGGVLTTLGGAAYAGTTYFNAPTEEISQLIEKEYTHILLKTGTDEDTDHWKKAWEIYKADNKNKDSDVFQLTGWQKDGEKDVTPELKKKCTALKTQKVYGKDDELYKNVTKYCGRYVTVLDEANKKRLTILDTNGDKSSTTWTSRNTNKKQFEAAIKALGMTYETVDANGIKDGCKKAVENNKKLPNYKTLSEAYEKVCTNPKGSTQ